MDVKEQEKDSNSLKDNFYLLIKKKPPLQKMEVLFCSLSSKFKEPVINNTDSLSIFALRGLFLV